LALSCHSGHWRLDTPAGPVRFAGSPQYVPPTLSRLVRAYTRDDDLVRVGRLRDGGLAELREDLGPLWT